MSKKIRLLLISMIVMLLLGVSAMAEESPYDLLADYETHSTNGWITAEVSSGRFVAFNEMYMDAASVQETLESPVSLPTGKTGLRKTKSAASQTPVFETAEDAAAYIRQNLYARNDTISFAVSLSDSDYLSMWNEIFDLIYKHTGVSVEGDYLSRNMGIFQARYSVTAENVVTYTIYEPVYYTTAEQEQEVTQVVDALLDEFGFDASDTEYDRIRTIYDYIGDNITYEYSDDGTKLRYTTYAAAVNKCAVCQGYSTLFYRLALESGLDARLVAGTSHQTNAQGEEELGDHGWNIVRIGDQYYSLDSTWDASRRQNSVSYLYFLKGSSNEFFSWSHVAGQYSDGTACDIPEEYAYLSEEDYAVPFEIVSEPDDLAVQMGDPVVFSVTAMGNDLSYTWHIYYGNTGHMTHSAARLSLGTVSESNSWYPYLDGLRVCCEIRDADGNLLYTTPTVTVSLYGETTLKAHSLSLNGDIAVNYYMVLADDVVTAPDAHMHFTIPGITATEVDVPVSEAEPCVFEVDGVSYSGYRFSAGTPAKDMTQPIHAVFYLDDKNSSMEDWYCVEDYAKVIRENEAAYGESLYEMVTAMLNYGGYAQQYFDYHTEALANRTLEDTSLPDLAIGDSFARVKDGTVEGLRYVGSRLILKSNTKIWHYLQIDGDISDYTFAVDGKEVSAIPNNEGENYYVVEIAGISAKNLDEAYTLTVTKKGTQETFTVTYSCYSSCKSITEQTEKYSLASRNMMKALYWYGEAANEYFAA